MWKPESWRIVSLLGFILYGSITLSGQDSTSVVDTTTFPLPANGVTQADSLGEALDAQEFLDSIATSRFVYDSSRFDIRAISSSDIESYRNDDAFDYARTTKPPTNFLGKIFYWFFQFVDDIFDNKVAGRTLIYLLFFVALVLVVWFIVRSESGGLFLRGGSKNVPLDFEEMPEDIHAIDFDRLTTEALAAGEFRRAVRLHYLKLLRTMSERELIEWRREKTNGDYLRELQDDGLRSRFAELTLLFDYVWYGGFEVDHSQYSRIDEAFASFSGQLERRG